MREDVEALKKEVEEVREQSAFMELLKDQKTQNKRLFIIILVILGMFTCLLGFTLWLINDIGTIDTDTIDIEDVENIDSSTIKIGNDTWVKSK